MQAILKLCVRAVIVGILEHGVMMKSGLALLFLLQVGLAHATDPVSNAPTAQAIDGITAAVAVDAIEAKYSRIISIHADFEQVKKDAFGEISQSGKLVASKPAKMRWEFTTGDRQVFATDGSTLTVWVPTTDYFEQMPDTTGQSVASQGFLTSLDRLDQFFDVSLVSADKTDVVLSLTPKGGGQVKGLLLGFSRDWEVKSAKITDHYDNITELSFTGVKYDQPTSDALFRFGKPTALDR